MDNLERFPKDKVKNNFEKFNVNVSYLTEIIKYVSIFNGLRIKMSDGTIHLIEGIDALLEIMDILFTMAYPKCYKMDVFIEAEKEFEKEKTDKLHLYMTGSDGRRKYYPERTEKLKSDIIKTFKSLLVCLEEKGMLTAKSTDPNFAFSEYE